MAHAHKVQANGAQVTGWVGWVMAAAFLLGFTGILHIAYGLAALMSQDWYITSAGTVYMLDMTQWGWALVLGGILMLVSSGLLYTGNMAGRVLGAVLTIGSIVANIALFAVAPV